jgi:hypothetical protein
MQCLNAGHLILPLESRGTPLSINAYGQWIVTIHNISSLAMSGI